MRLSEENLVMGPVARVELGKPGSAISHSRYSAIKRAMGLTGRYVLVSDMRKWLRANPNFSELDIYPRNRSKRPRLATFVSIDGQNERMRVNQP